MSMAITAAVVVAGGTAYAANKQAKAAKQGSKSYTDSTTTQNPYLSGQLQPGLDAVLERQGQMFNMVPQVGANGQVTYVNPVGANGGPQVNNGVPAGYVKRPDGRVVKEVAPAPKGGGKGAATGGTTTGAPKAGPAKTPTGMFQDIYASGMGGPSQMVKTGDRAMTNILGAAGGNGPAGGEQTGFEGYNPILDFQAQQLMGEQNQGKDLLLQYLGNKKGSGSSGAGEGDRRVNYSTVANAYGGGGGGGGTAAAGGGVPDTMTGKGWFQDKVNEMWGQGPDPELQTLIDAHAADSEKAYWRSVADADAASAGAGRLGGGSWAAQRGQARQDFSRDVGNKSAEIRVGDRAMQKQIQQGLIGQVNQRDQAAMTDATQRYGINASSSAASAGAGAAAESARRGQDLQAIMGLMGYETDQSRLLSGIGSQLSGDRLGTLGLIPGQEDARYAGTDRALGAANGLAGYDASKYATSSSANIARQQMAQQQGMFNAQQQQASIDNYLRTLGVIGGMGGTQTTQGTNAVPGANISTGAATAMGALGGAMAGYGAYNQYKR